MQNFNYIEGNICDLDKEGFFPGRIIIKNGRIFRIKKLNEKFKNYILPGFINSHCHIESSFLPPSVFATLAVSHGTVAVVADCHEIANVFGEKGISWMLKSARLVPFGFFWSLPSCVPATPFETTPNKIGVKETEKYLKRKEFVSLGEMMNFPGVISGDQEIFNKIKIAKKYKKPIDGHCPQVFGENLKKYISAGITTDHECTNLREAKEKQKLGMIIQIREGSSAKNLKDLIGLDYKKCFLVTDDLDVEDLLRGELNEVIKKAVKLGVPFFKAIKMATVLPARHYGLNFGEIKIGKEANLSEFEDLKNLKPERVWIRGKLAFQNEKALFPKKTLGLGANIAVEIKSENDFKIRSEKNNKIRAIKLIPDQILTEEIAVKIKPQFGELKQDLRRDILKIAAINRYGKEYIGLGFVNGFGLKKGALASSISHDSHNLICVGANDSDMAKAVNILRKEGGFVFVSKNKVYKVGLPLAGLMSDKDPKKLVEDFKELKGKLRKYGCRLGNPLSQIVFLSLLVIPELKISDRGLFDVKKFRFTKLFV
ncbi:MAG: adenine deaminase [Patescibacteria group bacterium]